MSDNTIAQANQQFITVADDLKKSVLTGMNKTQQQRFMQIVTDRFRDQPELAKCTAPSVASAFKELALSNVEPTVQHAVLISRYNKERGSNECTLQWTAEGKKRAINVATNGQYYVHADVVCQKDEYSAGGFPRKLKSHEFDSFDRGEIIGAFAVLMRASDSEQMFLVEMPREEIEKIRDDASKQSTGKPWKTYFSEMAIKTAVGRLHKKLKANINTYMSDAPSEQTIDMSDSQVEVEPVAQAIEATVSHVTNNDEAEISVDEEAAMDLEPVTK